MLRRIRIQGFKSAVDVTLELGRLNVVVGPNGAGKTNLLEAVSLLGCAASGRVDYDGFRARGVRPGAPALYRTALAAETGRPRPITLEAASDKATYEVSLEDPVKAKRGSSGNVVSWRFTEETLTEGEEEVGTRTKRRGQITNSDGKQQKVTPELDRGIGPLLGPIRGAGEIASLLRTLEGFAIYTPLTPILRALIPDPVQKSPVGLMGGGLAEGLFSLGRSRASAGGPGGRLQEEIRALIDWWAGIRFGTSSIRLARLAGESGAKLDPHVTLQFQDRFMSSGSLLSAAEVNEGALHVLCLLLLLFHPATPRLLAIDNVDHALHPQLARYFLERMQAIVLQEPERPQLLLTAHNPLVLDALSLGDDRVRLFIASRDKRSGAMQVRRFPYSEALEKSKKEGMTLSRLWVSGALGGVPNR